MANYEVSLKELCDQIADMLTVCFEGEVSERESGIELLLGNGQRFCLSVGEAA